MNIVIPLLESVGAGGKGERLRAIAQLGLDIPRTYVLPLSLFPWILEHNKAKTGAELSSNLTLPPEFEQALAEFYITTFANTTVVTRSSASSEDSPFVSCAGCYESFLNRKTVDDLIHGVCACYASLATESAKLYLSCSGLSVANEQMAVLIQEQISVECSGVLFTRHPYDGSDDMIVEWVAGLGTAVVAGRTNPITRRLRRNFRNELTELEARLLQIGAILEEAFGGPQDIEWGVIRDKLYVFQSRNVTTPTFFAPLIPKPTGIIMMGGSALSPGVAIGQLVTDSRSNGGLLYINNTSNEHLLAMVRAASGVITPSGGMLSHLGTVLRELRIPGMTLNLDKNLSEFIGRTLIMDTLHGTLIDMSTQDTKTIMEYIFFDLWCTSSCSSQVYREHGTAIEFNNILFPDNLEKQIALLALDSTVEAKWVTSFGNSETHSSSVQILLESSAQHKRGTAILSSNVTSSSQERSCFRVWFDFSTSKQATKWLAKFSLQPVREYEMVVTQYKFNVGYIEFFRSSHNNTTTIFIKDGLDSLVHNFIYQLAVSSKDRLNQDEGKFNGD